jgi:hypothetical protein
MPDAPTSTSSTSRGEHLRSRTLPPDAREEPLPSDDLAVATKPLSTVRTTVVDATDRPLYRLLVQLLEDTHVPDLMPAHLATECRDLVDARETLTDIHRGIVDLDGCGYSMSYCYRVRDIIDDHRDRPPVQLVVTGPSVPGVTDKPQLLAEMEALDIVDDGHVQQNRWRGLDARDGLVAPGDVTDLDSVSVRSLEGVPVHSSGRLPSGAPVDTKPDVWARGVFEELQAWLHDVAGGIAPRDIDLQVIFAEEHLDRVLSARGVFSRIRAPGGLTVDVQTLRSTE